MAIFDYLMHFGSRAHLSLLNLEDFTKEYLIGQLRIKGGRKKSSFQWPGHYKKNSFLRLP